MSRLGDMIQKERLERKLSAKEVAKMCGVTEKYLQEVERGTRIIGDDMARRILRTMGKKGEIEEGFEAMVFEDQKLPQTTPKPAAAPAKAVSLVASSSEGDGGGSFMEALGGVVRAVPILDGAGKRIGSRMLATENGKIEGAPPDKVFYQQITDASMRGYRLRQGDLLLVVPATSPADGATMLVQEGDKRVPRRVTRQDGGKVLLQWFEGEPQSRTASEKEVLWLGRAVRCEFPL